MIYDNVSSNPAAFGLIEIASLEDPGSNFDFRTVVFWWHEESGRVLGAWDAGCSCPAPFEDYCSIESLTPIYTLDVADELICAPGCDYLHEDKEGAIRAIRERLNHREAVANPGGGISPMPSGGSDAGAVPPRPGAGT